MKKITLFVMSLLFHMTSMYAQNVDKCLENKYFHSEDIIVLDQVLIKARALGIDLSCNELDIRYNKNEIWFTFIDGLGLNGSKSFTMDGELRINSFVYDRKIKTISHKVGVLDDNTEEWAD